MRGHQAIHKARTQGYMPRLVTIFADGLGLPIRKFTDPESNLSMGCDAELWIEFAEFGKPLDFRFLVGCSVRINGIEMTEEFVGLLDRIAERAHHIVANTHDCLMEFKNKKWEVLWTC